MSDPCSAHQGTCPWDCHINGERKLLRQDLDRKTAELRNTLTNWRAGEDCCDLRDEAIAEADRLRASLDEAGRVLGQVIIIPLLQECEALAEPVEHAAVDAALLLLQGQRRQEARAEQAEEERDALAWQVSNWERKAVTIASCCVDNERRAKAAEAEVLRLKAAFGELDLP